VPLLSGGDGLARDGRAVPAAQGRESVQAVLLVDITHPKVQALYESWGYGKIGEDQPFPDSPVYAVMLADLPLS
jgi:hypothetical protein